METGGVHNLFQKLLWEDRFLLMAICSDRRCVWTEHPHTSHFFVFRRMLNCVARDIGSRCGACHTIHVSCACVFEHMCAWWRHTRGRWIYTRCFQRATTTQHTPTATTTHNDDVNDTQPIKQTLSPTHIQQTNSNTHSNNIQDEKREEIKKDEEKKWEEENMKDRREGKTGEKRRKEEKEKEKWKRKRKMKMKRKIHPNIPNKLITDYSYIFCTVFQFIRDTVTFLPFWIINVVNFATMVPLPKGAKWRHRIFIQSLRFSLSPPRSSRSCRCQGYR